MLSHFPLNIDKPDKNFNDYSPNREKSAGNKTALRGVLNPLAIRCTGILKSPRTWERVGISQVYSLYTQWQKTRLKNSKN